MANCKKCGTPAEGSDAFCANCGAPLSAADVCPQCGTELEEGARFCAGCGQALPSPSSATPFDFAETAATAVVLEPTAPSDLLLRIRDLRYRYPGSQEDILRIPSLDVSGRGLIALTGPSGAGKTTLVELLAGTLRESYDGHVQVLGREWKDLRKDADRQRHMRRIGLIPQDFGLLASWTPRESIEQDLSDAGVPKGEHAARVTRSLEQVGLAPFAERRISGLSGGQRQRVAIARMLARDVELVIADEPTANLDPERVAEIVALLKQLALKAPVIVVTHDPGVAESCDRTIVLQAAVAGLPGEMRVAATAAPTAHLLTPARIGVLAIVVVLIAVVAALAAVAFGHGQKPGGTSATTAASPASAVVASTSPTAAAAASPAQTPSAVASPTSPGAAGPAVLQAQENVTGYVTAMASSTLAPYDGNTYAASNLLDGDLTTCWAEGSPGYGLGEWVMFSFSQPVVLTQMKVVPGYMKRHDGWDRWWANGRLRSVLLTFSDGSSQDAAIADREGWQVLHFDKVQTSWVKMTILSAYPARPGPHAATDLCVSEVEFVGSL